VRRLAPLLLVALLAGGCWDRTEVNDIALVTAMAIDVGSEHPYRLSLQIILPQLVGARSPGGGVGAAPARPSKWPSSAGGAPLMEAADSIQRRSPGGSGLAIPASSCWGRSWPGGVSRT